MGRLGPLTSQALGRSPYDEVFEGEGEDQPGASAQAYDSRGRPVNPETKRIHRDMVRAHNEVMQVIGVAEADNNAAAEADLQRQHHNYEDAMGNRILGIGRATLIHGVWGLVGARQRILLYKEYAHIPFLGLYQYERGHSSILKLLFSGVPAHVIVDGLKEIRHISYDYFGKQNFWVDGIIWYLRTHLQVYIALQRFNMIPSSQWFPRPLFFVPFTKSSLIAAPPPLKDFAPRSLVQWVGGLCISVAPITVFYLWCQIWKAINSRLWSYLLERIPSTAHRRKESPPSPQYDPEVLRQFEESLRTVTQTPTQAQHPPRSAGSQTPLDPPPTETVRRPSAVSARGDDYPSDEDDHEPMNPTVISFDIEPTDTTDAPPGGLWSAELRPSLAPDVAKSQANQKPVYLDTMLTRVPAIFAVDIFAGVITYAAAAPLEAFALRLVGRAFRQHLGLPTNDIQDLNIFSNVTWMNSTNFIGLEFVHLVVASELWAMVTGVCQWYHYTEEEWKEKQVQRLRETEARV